MIICLVFRLPGTLQDDCGKARIQNGGYLSSAYFYKTIELNFVNLIFFNRMMFNSYILIIGLVFILISSTKSF